jgi:hypothetical protein
MPDKLPEPLPRRPYPHVLGDRAERAVTSGFPSEWIVRRVSYDYGTDLNVEIVEAGSVTGINFSVQVKGVSKCSSVAPVVTVRLQTSTINYLRARPEPVMLAVYVAADETVYWTWIDASEPKPRGLSTSIRVPKRQVLAHDQGHLLARQVREQIGMRARVGSDVQKRLKAFGRYSIDLTNRRDLLLREEVDRFDRLVNDENIREVDIQRFIEQHPQLVVGPEYVTMHSLIRLEGDDRVLVPDFMLVDVSGFCDILELKRPNTPTASGYGSRRRMSAQAFAAVEQTKAYQAYFEDEERRAWVERSYGLRVYKPKLIVLIGRDSMFADGFEKRRLAAQLGDIRILTYDDLLRLARLRQVA